MKANNLTIIKQSEKIKHKIPDFITVKSLEELDMSIINNDKLYAVRSSCSEEDSKTESHAGQFKTILNVPKDRIKDAIEEVQSSYSGLDGRVIIQEMVKSEISGVVFTANPVGILNEVVVVAGEGLGDNIVEDKVETSSYYYNIDDKIYYVDGEDILSANMLNEIIDTAIEIKNILGCEADIEYGIECNKLFILQARPITTLNNADDIIILDNSNIVESYPGISAPLTQDFAKQIYSNVFRSLVKRLTKDERLVDKMKEQLENMVDTANGRMYYRIDNWYSILNILPFSSKITEIWQEMLGVSNKEIKSNIRVNTYTKIRLIKQVVYLIITSASKMKWLNKWFDCNISKFKNLVRRSNTIEELLESYDIIMKEITEVWDLTLVNDMYTFIFTYLAGNKNKEQLANIKDLESMKPVIELNKLIEVYQLYGESEQYIQAEKEYIEEFGDRCPEELKLETRTYRTNPEMLRDYIRQANRIEIKTSKESNKQNIFVKKAKLGMYNREISRLNRTRIFGLAREIMLKIGGILVEKEYLNDKEDVFYLHYNELHVSTDYKNIIDERKALSNMYKNTPSYSRLVFNGEIINKRVYNSAKILSVNNKLYGIASSVGKITGEVIVVDTPNLKINTRNKILVCKSTDPGWVFLIKDSIGVVTEKGSMLSHTAIITRELMKPSVVNVKDITRVVNSGDVIEVDAINGVVKLLNKKEIRNGTE